MKVTVNVKTTTTVGVSLDTDDFISFTAMIAEAENLAKSGHCEVVEEHSSFRIDDVLRVLRKFKENRDLAQEVDHE